MSKRRTHRSREPEPKGPTGDETSLSILPMQLRVGDRYSDELGEWEVVSLPTAFRSGKSYRARVQLPGQPASVREDTWEAHERITVRRG